MARAQHWTQRREGGGWFAIWLIRTIGLRIGRRPARALLYPITLYFYFRRPFERRTSYQFLSRTLGRPASAWDVMRHIHRFASTILDRVFLLAGNFTHFDVRIHNLDELVSRARNGGGVLLLGSHVGSFEVLRVAATRTPDIKVSVVLDRQQTPAMTQLLHAINPQFAQDVIDASQQSIDIVLAVGDAVRQGKVTSLLADRARPHEMTVAVDFFGAPAVFPVAPFRIGAILQVPVVLCFGMYRGGNRYDLYFESFAERLVVPRRNRETELRAIVQRYVSRLEYFVRNDPYNWFNWHDVWNLESERNQATDVAETSMEQAPTAGSA